MWDRLNGLQSVQLFFYGWMFSSSAWGMSPNHGMWLNRLLLERIFMEEHLNSHQSNHQELWNSILTMLNLSVLSFAVDANHAQGLSHQCKETQDLRNTVMQINKSNCHCLSDSTSSMWRKQTTFFICSAQTYCFAPPWDSRLVSRAGVIHYH